ncbi:MAG: hypothetical protein IPJ13_26535 [Saprospiraceae bacterium]|nr:hypothetical protein [Saprospiraceae bacterium]
MKSYTKCPFCNRGDQTIDIDHGEKIFDFYKQHQFWQPGVIKRVESLKCRCGEKFFMPIIGYDLLKCADPNCNEWVVAEIRKDLIAIGTFLKIENVPPSLRYDAIFNFKCVGRVSHQNIICATFEPKNRPINTNLSVEI